MRDFIKTLESTGLNALHIKIYHQGLLATPLMLSAMVLIAAVVSLRPPRARGQLIMILSGIGAGFAIFFLTSFLKALGTTEQIPLLLAAWAPSLICCLIGTAILMRTEDG
jgi:lipopolysaccharide export system permease protein